MPQRTQDTLKTNLRRWLAHHGVSAHKVSIAAGMGGSWCSDLLHPKRYKTSMSMNVADDLSETLGVPAWELMRSRFDPDDHEAPEWVAGEREDP